ncbi:hypothetical protein ACS3SW_08430 [Roseobacteraceae bacterium S113]
MTRITSFFSAVFGIMLAIFALGFFASIGLAVLGFFAALGAIAAVAMGLSQLFAKADAQDGSAPRAQDPVDAQPA